MHSMKSPTEAIVASLGVLRFHYYHFVHEFHMKPRDLEELVDGVLYMDCHAYSERYALKRAKANGKGGR